MSDQPEATPAERRAVFRVVRGTPTAAELAALAVTLAAMSGAGGGEPAPGPRGAWNDPARPLRAQLSPGPGAWRTSTWPR